MHRRTFLRTTTAAAALATVPVSAGATRSDDRPFALDFAPHLGQFRHLGGGGIEEEIAFVHAAGFRSIEDNTYRLRPPEEQRAITTTLQRLGMRMGVFVAVMPDWGAQAPMLTSGDAEYVRYFLDETQAASDLALDIGVTWMTVVPGHLHPRLPMEVQTAHVVDALRRAAEIVAPRGQVLVIEPLNAYFDHPRIFLQDVWQAYGICRGVDSPGVKILADLYHEQASSGNLIGKLEKTWDEIAYVQVGDVPGRREPTTGEINYANVFRWLEEKGYSGIVGMEHGMAGEGAAGEQAVIDAYRQVDPVAETPLFRRPQR